MQIPTQSECFELMAQMGMLDHIREHSLQVCRVALLLTDLIGSRCTGLDRELIRAAALLHDITKTRSFETREDHARTGSELLLELGYPEVGVIVGQHVRLNRYPEADALTEAEIVNYADKRVLHDRVVSLDRRMTYIVERYAVTPELKVRARWLWDRTLELEQRIFGLLSISPDALSGLL